MGNQDSRNRAILNSITAINYQEDIYTPQNEIDGTDSSMEQMRIWDEDRRRGMQQAQERYPGIEGLSPGPVEPGGQLSSDFNRDEIRYNEIKSNLQSRASEFIKMTRSNKRRGI